MRIKRTLVAPLVVGAIGLMTGGWFLQRGAKPEQNVYMQARLFEEVLHRISDDFVEAKQPSDLYRMAIDGMIQELGDPHTAFMTPSDYEKLRIQTEGQYGGLGIEVDVRDGWVTVISPLPGTPAEKAGLQAGDRIIQVDGESTRGWTIDDAVGRLRGAVGAPVDIKVARVGGDQPIPFHIVRQEVHVQSVPTSYMLNDRVGYLDLTVFAQSSTDEMREAIEKLKTKGMKALVIDLRNNPGGLLEQGVSLSDLFLERGKTVVETRSRVRTMNQRFLAETADRYPDLPLVLLVNPFSASAAEIFSGALQDHDRALIVGQTTYGKGSVQTIYQLSGGNVLKLTTGRWYTPSGRSIQKPFNSDHPDVLIADASVREDSADVAKNDTAAAHIYHTDMGRSVRGGGGITPDLTVASDTVTVDERALGRAVEKYGSKFFDVLYAYAVRYAHDHPGLQPGFPVTPQLLDGFYGALQKQGIDIERGVFDAASGAIGDRIALEIARDKWGQLGLRKRLNAADPQVKVALQVLERATTPKSVFALADRIRLPRAAIGNGGAAPGGNR